MANVPTKFHCDIINTEREITIVLLHEKEE